MKHIAVALLPVMAAFAVPAFVLAQRAADRRGPGSSTCIST